eukprot:TRINITY_DN7091_c0_g1_i1.p1 TRINITY_DN7091_c0_g1~~TRINITY_DN7091_c0_g1_i1.p1  ORF type:complete len:248 (+),score=41.47 TRINITY_DN7091_c0_g1_i1:110-853(+)
MSAPARPRGLVRQPTLIFLLVLVWGTCASRGYDDDDDECDMSSLRKYSTKVFHPDRLHSDDVLYNVTEVAPQIYRFQLFTPEFCAKLIRDGEKCQNWKVQKEDFFEKDAFLENFGRVEEAEKTLDLEEIGMDTWYYHIAKKHIVPIMRKLWRSFTVTKFDEPYLLKYEVNLIKGMRLHNDLETVSMIVYLNDEYEGGGTHFPRYNFSTATPKPVPGTAVLYPGRLSHEHEGLPITQGVRFLLLAAYY